MSKIQDAFDSMLSELMAAKVRIGVLEEQERIARKTPASREIDLVQSEDSVFAELYESCAEAEIALKSSGLLAAIQVAEKLEAAVIAARKIIDPIPF